MQARTHNPKSTDHPQASDLERLAQALRYLALPLKSTPESSPHKAGAGRVSAKVLLDQAAELDSFALDPPSSRADQALLDGVHLAKLTISEMENASPLARLNWAARRSRRFVLKGLLGLVRRDYFDSDDNTLYLFDELQQLRERALKRTPSAKPTRVTDVPTRRTASAPRI
jgi:hypothetical protein